MGRGRVCVGGLVLPVLQSLYDCLRGTFKNTHMVVVGDPEVKIDTKSLKAEFHL